MDPFTEVLGKLWELLETNAAFTSLVKIGNRIKLYEGSVKPLGLLENRSQIDLPAITILPAGTIMNPAMTSTDAVIRQTYRIHAEDGNLLLSKTYFPLKWALFKSIVNMDNYLGLSYVRKIEIDDGSDTPNDETNPSWTMGIDIHVTMIWKRSFLKAT